MFNVTIELTPKTTVGMEIEKITPIIKYRDKFYIWHEFADYIAIPNGEYVEAEMQEIPSDRKKVVNE